jgi:hypothetical protein
VIFFHCSACSEELEAEDSIRGAKMKCPACWKEIEVPQAGMKRTTGIRKRPTKAAGKAEPAEESGDTEEAAPYEDRKFGRFVKSVFLGGLVGVFVLVGAGWYMVERAEQKRLQARPRCDRCDATGKILCSTCGGKSRQPCKECSGTGKRKNVREEEETCFACSGQGGADCPICGGRGKYGCPDCRGSGFLDGPPPN